MKTIVLVVVVVAVASAIPKPTKPLFRNMYKTPITKIEVPPNPRIIGGQPAAPNSIPYQAFLEVLGPGEYWLCGGSLISQNYVLSAGHCGADGALQAYITLGAHNPYVLEDTQINLYSYEITVHEHFSQTYLSNDISVFKLEKPVTFSDVIQAAVLPSWDDVDNTYEHAVARVSGWGLLDGGDNHIADVLHYVDVTVINNRVCEKSFSALHFTVMCTSGDDLTGVCNGDSGGPLVTDGVQIGVVSFTVLDCIRGYPSGYARVTKFLDWIEEHTDVEISGNKTVTY